MPKELTELDKKVYKYVLSKGKEGVPQNVLWKELKITSRDASRVLKKLEALGYVKREPIIYGGRRTYRVIAIPKPIETKKKPSRPIIDFRKYFDIPCMVCPNIDKCYQGGYFDPTICDLLTEWIQIEISRKKAKHNM